MKILVTGGTGQVGLALQRLKWPEGVSIQAPERAELDLTHSTAVTHYFSSRSFAAVINAAAFTAVDKAEEESLAAFAVNALAPAVLAQATRAAGIPLVHVSTDYVFDGSKPDPYQVEDPVRPIGVYGASKEAGEQAVRTINARHAIVRTAWLVSQDRTNFVKTMLRLGAERPSLRVVSDQKGCPTSADDLAWALAQVVLRMAADNCAPTGTFHCVNDGEATWYELASFVFDVAERLGRDRPKIEAIQTTDFPTPARRPLNSRLDCGRLIREYGLQLRPWRTSIEQIVEELIRK